MEEWGSPLELPPPALPSSRCAVRPAAGAAVQTVCGVDGIPHRPWGKGDREAVGEGGGEREAPNSAGASGLLCRRVPGDPHLEMIE